ncbi:MAG: hypothetical protein OQK67_01950 [Chlorobium sp.]|nr:hypothetical protein [Chlorobium sp.]MCW8815201.1 hypothetical protein [Chlorobium sp.]
MEQFVTLLVENPLYLVIAVILSIAVLLLFLKKLLKLIVFVTALFILYLGYLYVTGENIPEVVHGVQQIVDSLLEKGVDYVKELGGSG